MSKVIYAIGDLHGRADLLHAIRKIIDADAKKHGFSEKKIVYLGDYVDRGPNSKEILETLSKKPMQDFIEVHLKGNHEEMMYNAFRDGRKAFVDLWVNNGGDTTLASYGITENHYHLYNVTSRTVERHLDWMNALPTSHRDGRYFFVHAGIYPGIPLEDQENEVLLWIRKPFLHYKGLHIDSNKQLFKVVHGHTPSLGKVEIFDNRINVDTGSVWTGKQYAIALHDNMERIIQTPQFDKN